MVKVNHSVTVARPVEDVFAFVANNYFQNAAKWNPSLITLKQTIPGPMGVGTTGFEVEDFKGKHFERHVAVREFVLNKQFMLKTVESASNDSYVARYTFQPSGIGTKVTVDYEVEMPTKMFKYFKPLAEKFVRDKFQENIGTRMKGVIERSTL
jgi:hypothetical protein